jgi:hypothetical protein
MSIDFLDPPAPTMPEHELTRRRAHLLQEIGPAPAALPHGSRNALLGIIGKRTPPVVALAAVITALVAVLPGQLHQNRMTLVDQAIAAIGTGPTIHVVLDQGRNTRLVNLRTGKVTLLRNGLEAWSDPKLGTLWISTIDGKPTETYVALRSERASAIAWWRPYVSGYADQLRSGTYHVVGKGQVAGRAVDWIAGAPMTMKSGKQAVTEIAISQTTYKPLYFRQRIDGALAHDVGIRVLIAETLPRRPALFAHRVTVAPGITSSVGSSTGIPTTLGDARAAMRPDPIVPSARIAGLRRTWVGLPDYLIPPYTSYRDQAGGVALYYGPLDGTGHPAYRGSYISINEFPRKDAIKLWGPGLFRQDGVIVTQQDIATFKTHGLYMLIQAGSRHDALAAARALGH